MDEAEIRATHAGKTFAGAYPDGQEFVEYQASDGRVSFVQVDGTKHQGTWSIDGGAFCYSYPSIRGGKPYCFTAMARDGEILHFWASGSKKGSLGAVVETIEDGNSRGLPLN